MIIFTVTKFVILLHEVPEMNPIQATIWQFSVVRGGFANLN